MQLQAAAQQAIDEHEAAIAAARNKFTAGLDPTGTQAGAVPIDAAERVQAELMAQEQARQAAQAANVAQVAQEGQNLRAGQGGGVSSPVDPFHEEATTISRSQLSCVTGLHYLFDRLAPLRNISGEGY